MRRQIHQQYRCVASLASMLSSCNLHLKPVCVRSLWLCFVSSVVAASILLNGAASMRQLLLDGVNLVR